MPSPWTDHPKLRGRFHAEFPDDLQVIVHDGSPQISHRHAELVWVRITGFENDRFSGVVLNQPDQLRSVAEGSQIVFIVPESGEHPLQVSSKYLDERSNWRLLAPCNKCGLTELFDSPSELVASTFPSVAAEQLSLGFTFTTRCGWCGGGQVVRLKRTRWPWSEEKL